MGSRPIEFRHEPRAPLDSRVVAVTDRDRTHLVLQLPSNVQKGATLGSTQPFVTVAGVVVRTDGLKIQGHHARRMSAIDEHAHASRPTQGDDTLDRKDQARWTRDVIHQQQLGTRRQAGLDGCHNLVRRVDRKGHLSDNGNYPKAFPEKAHDVIAGVVAVASEDQLVTRSKGSGAQDGVHRLGNVPHEH